jgi:hypothetical protein
MTTIARLGEKGFVLEAVEPWPAVKLQNLGVDQTGPDGPSCIRQLQRLVRRAVHPLQMGCESAQELGEYIIPWECTGAKTKWTERAKAGTFSVIVVQLS